MAETAKFDRCEIRRASHHLACEVGNEKVVLQTKSGQYLGMNPVGAFIWDLLTVPRRSSELIEQLVGRYDVDSATAQTDVDSFIAELAEVGLIEVQKL
jgi:hypothetical protein